MYAGKRTSLVFPTFNEEENIANAIKNFKNLRIFDEIIVVDNNSKDKTASIARKFGAKVVKEEKQGYGFAIRKGLLVAKGYYIVLCEPDATFSAQDSLKLLKNLSQYDIVIGTRTNKNFIKKGARMSGAVRLGNILLAKIITLLFRTPSLSDCGCTYRAFKRKVSQTILPRITVGGSHLLPEIVILSSLHRFEIKEIPVYYRKRVGNSKITGSTKRAIYVGAKMLLLILKYRLSTHLSQIIFSPNWFNIL